jgi:NifB/MoaA-like Fe-S oxidoreductase
LQPTTPEGAAAVLDIVERFAEECFRELDTRLAWCGDELYLKANRPLPEDDYYEDYTQFENGIGMLTLFGKEFRRFLPDYAGQTARPFTIATGAAAGPFLKGLLAEAEAVCGKLNGRVEIIRNDFFGEQVSVAGLITGQDLTRQLSDKALGERVLISANMLRDGGDVFLDDMTPAQAEAALGVPLVPVEIDGAALLEAIFEE